MIRVLCLAGLCFCRITLASADDRRAGFHVILELDNLIPSEGFTEKEESVEITLMNMSDFLEGRSDLIEDELRRRGYPHPKHQMAKVPPLRIVNRHGGPVRPPPSRAVSQDEFPLSFRGVYVMNVLPDGVQSTGDIVIDVFPDQAPLGAARVRKLVASGAWELSRFFKVVPGFAAQWGLPAAAVGGGAECRGQGIADDVVSKDGPWNTPFSVAFLSKGVGTRNCQAFINYAYNGKLNGMVVPFGQVVKGFRVAARILSRHGKTPDEAEVVARGNAYLDESFPGLSYVRTAKIVEGPFPRDMSKTPKDLYEAELAAAGLGPSAPKKDDL